MRQDCEYIEQLMTDELDGQLSPDHRTILQDHLDSCPVCRQLHGKLETARSACALLRKQRSAVVMPVHLPVMIKQRIQKRPSWSGIPIWRYATGLTMVVLLIAVVFVYRNIIPAIQNSTTAGIAGTDAAFADRQESAGEKKATLDDLGLSSQPATKKAGGVMSVAVATTGAASRASAATPENATTGAPYVLYSGSLADLKPIRDLKSQPAAQTNTTSATVGNTTMAPIPVNFFSDTLPATVSNAKVLRVLTNSGDTVRQVVIMAGFDEAMALQALDQLRQQVKPEQSSVCIETVLPVGHARLKDLLGLPLYEQLLPSSTERQLTYLLIMIGG